MIKFRWDTLYILKILHFQGLRMPEPVSAKPVPKLRAKSATKGRPRPKTIHVDQDADVNAALQQSRVGPRGSISNISGRLLISILYICMHAKLLFFLCFL